MMLFNPYYIDTSGQSELFQGLINPGQVKSHYQFSDIIKVALTENKMVGNPVELTSMDNTVDFSLQSQIDYQLDNISFPNSLVHTSAKYAGNNLGSPALELSDQSLDISKLTAPKAEVMVSNEEVKSLFENLLSGSNEIVSLKSVGKGETNVVIDNLVKQLHHLKENKNSNLVLAFNKSDLNTEAVVEPEGIENEIDQSALNIIKSLTEKVDDQETENIIFMVSAVDNSVKDIPKLNISTDAGEAAEIVVTPKQKNKVDAQVASSTSKITQAAPKVEESDYTIKLFVNELDPKISEKLNLNLASNDISKLETSTPLGAVKSSNPKVTQQNALGNSVIAANNAKVETGSPNVWIVNNEELKTVSDPAIINREIIDPPPKENTKGNPVNIKPEVSENNNNALKEELSKLFGSTEEAEPEKAIPANKIKHVKMSGKVKSDTFSKNYLKVKTRGQSKPVVENITSSSLGAKEIIEKVPGKVDGIVSEKQVNEEVKIQNPLKTQNELSSKELHFESKGEFSAKQAVNSTKPQTDSYKAAVNTEVTDEAKISVKQQEGKVKGTSAQDQIQPKTELSAKAPKKGIENVEILKEENNVRPSDKPVDKSSFKETKVASVNMVDNNKSSQPVGTKIENLNNAQKVETPKSTMDVKPEANQPKDNVFKMPERGQFAHPSTIKQQGNTKQVVSEPKLEDTKIINQKEIPTAQKTISVDQQPEIQVVKNDQPKTTSLSTGVQPKVDTTVEGVEKFNLASGTTLEKESFMQRPSVKFSQTETTEPKNPNAALKTESKFDFKPEKPISNEIFTEKDIKNVELSNAKPIAKDNVSAGNVNISTQGKAPVTVENTENQNNAIHKSTAKIDESIGSQANIQQTDKPVQSEKILTNSDVNGNAQSLKNETGSQTGNGFAENNTQNFGDKKQNLKENIIPKSQGENSAKVETESEFGLKTESTPKAEVNVKTEADGKEKPKVKTEHEVRESVNIKPDSDSKAEKIIKENPAVKVDANIKPEETVTKDPLQTIAGTNNPEQNEVLKPVVNQKQKIETNDNSRPDSRIDTARPAETINRSLNNLKEVVQVDKKVEVGRVMDEVANYIKAGNKKSITIALDPEKLGHVKLSIDASKNIVNAKVEVESAKVLQMFQNNSEMLKNMIQQNGIQLNSLSVSVGNSEEKANNFSKSKKKAGETNISPKGKIDDVAPDYISKDLGYNTYDYII